MGCYSICVSLVGQVVCLVCLHTQLIIFQKDLQYKPIAKAIIPNADAEVPNVENILTFIEEQILLLGYVQTFVNVIFMLKIDICLISGILWAKSCNLSSVRLDRFKDCIRHCMVNTSYQFLSKTYWNLVYTVVSKLKIPHVVYCWMVVWKTLHWPDSCQANKLCHGKCSLMV